MFIRLLSLREGGRKDIDIDTVPKYRKLYSLPKREILVGTEHAIKAVDGSMTYDMLRNKFITVRKNTSGGQLNPLELTYVHVLRLMLPDQSIIKGSRNKHNQQEESISPKINMNYQKSTTRLPKGSNSYGNGGLILGRSRSRCSTKVTQFRRSFMDSAGNGMSNEMKLEIRDGKVVNLYKLICSKDLLLQSYKKIKSNPWGFTSFPSQRRSGSMTPVDYTTRGGDGINEGSFFEKLAEELRSEKFKFTAVKRIPPQKNLRGGLGRNGKQRPLGIPTSSSGGGLASPSFPMGEGRGRDKIVQESMRFLLELIYEGKFSDNSHGFRPGRSCHTALHQITK